MLYIFDLDGTIRNTLSGKPCPNEPCDQTILPNVLDHLNGLKSQGNKLAACSNQGGVSCGYITEYQAWKIAVETNNLLGWLLDDIRLSFFHCNGLKNFRYMDNSKPNPDMALQLMTDFAVKPEETIFVGNEYVDQECAKQAGIAFVWAHNFFKWPVDLLEWNKNGVFLTVGAKNEADNK